MAVVVMHQIKSTTSKAIGYIARPDATGDGLWVSTNAAVIAPSDSAAIARQFEATSERVGVTKPREGSVLAHHVIQSFDPSEAVDPETAHRLGVQFADQITGGAHEYVIATHLDKGHVHNHIIFNATNMETGRKFRCVKSTLASIRGMSDVLCRDAGLSVLPTPERTTGRRMSDIYRVLKGDSSKQNIRTEIDKAAMSARTWTEFEVALFRAGVEVAKRAGRNAAVTFRAGDEMRPVRDFRLGEAYTEDAIMARLARSAVNRITFDQSMIVRETRDAMTVLVPGTRRELVLTVAKTQIVRHGRTVRAFLPAAEEQMLADRRGKLAKTVPPGGLYRWFAEPDLAGVARAPRQGSDWAASLAGLRALEDRVNAKTRWVASSGREPAAALTMARRELASTRLEFQTRLVAAGELAGTPERADDIRVLHAELRITERQIDVLRRDIHALTALTQEETKMSIADRMTSAVDQRRRDDQAHEVRLDDAANDRETPAHAEQRQQQYERQEEAALDEQQEQIREDHEDDSRPMTLRERIETEAQRRADTDRDSGTGDRTPSR